MTAALWFGLAEVSACLNRKEALVLKRAILKNRALPSKIKARYVDTFNRGEMAFLLNKPRAASARAIEDTELLIIDYENIETLSQEMPELFKDILREMASRLERTSQTF